MGDAVNYKKFGRTGLRVSAVCLGSDNLGNTPYGADEATSFRILGRAIDDGINFIDTADIYALGRSEQVIGKYLDETGRRGDVVITSKFRMTRAKEPKPNSYGASRKHAMDAIEGTLKRLRTDYVDLYLVHAWDPATPNEETLRALDDIVHEGKARYVGCSNYPAWVLTEALWTSDVRNLVRLDCIQSVFNIVQPGLAEAVLPVAIQEEVAVTTYSALGSGFLTGKHERSGPKPETKFGDRDRSMGGSLVRRYWDDAKFDVVDRLKAISSESGQPMERLSLQWVRETPGVTCPIIGARTEEQYAGLIEAWNGEAPPEVMERVRTVAADYAAQRTWTNYPPAPPAL